MNPTPTAAVAPVRRSVTVDAPAERAFEVFTERFDVWWPRGHHIGAVAMAEAVIEPRPGGRWYERGVDGSECTWGTVLAWEPPRRLVLSWHLDGQFQFDPDPAHASEVEVTFTAEADGRTRVDLEHRELQRHQGGGGGSAVATGVGGEGGWTGLLQLFAGAVAG